MLLKSEEAYNLPSKEQRFHAAKSQTTAKNSVTLAMRAIGTFTSYEKARK